MPQNTTRSPLEGYREIVKKLGGDPQGLLQELGIEADTSNRQEIWIPYQQQAYLYENTAEQLGRPDFGLLMAGQSNIDQLGQLAVAMQNSNTVEEAQRLAAQYLFVATAAVIYKVDVGPIESSLALTFDLPNTPPGSIPQAEDAALGFTHRQVRMLSGSNYQLIGVELRHPPLCHESVYRDFFGAEVSFNTPYCRLTVSTKTLQSPLRDTSDTLRKMATHYLAAQNPTHNRSLTDQVELAIRRSLGTDSCNRESIAAALAIHPRTLQRRLKQEGESFNNLLDNIRSQLARYYLCDTDLSLAQISLMLGYSEQSIFSRRCRHWFKTAPSALRKH